MTDQIKPWIMHERSPELDNEEGEGWTAKLMYGDKWLLGRQYRTHERHGPKGDQAEKELWLEYNDGRSNENS